MGVSIVMHCDLQGCESSLKEFSETIGWWRVLFGSIDQHDEIVITPMTTEDFHTEVGEFYCCMAHAQQAVASEMILMQERKIEAQRDQIAADAYEPLAQK